MELKQYFLEQLEREAASAVLGLLQQNNRMSLGHVIGIEAFFR